MAHLPFGYRQAHRHKRTHAQMEEHGNNSTPAWGFDRLPTAQRPRSSFYSPAPHNHNRSHIPHDMLDSSSDEADGFRIDEHNNQASFRSPQANETHEQHTQTREMLSPIRQRYVGDGYDFRRPATAADDAEAEGDIRALMTLFNEDDDEEEDEEDEVVIDLIGNQDVIDLTADDSGYGDSQDDVGMDTQENRARQHHRPRLPRGMDAIIDLDSGHEQWNIAAPATNSPSSPEIEFISSRRITPRHRDTPAPNELQSDEVEFVRENALSQEEQRRWRERDYNHIVGILENARGTFTHLRARIDPFLARRHRVADAAGMERSRTPQGRPRGRQVRPFPLPRGGQFVHPILNFDMVGFDMGIPGARVPQPPPPPAYEAPPKAPKGFTRSPEEEDVLVCPNCGDELCSGDGEVKRQVWIAKTCGHVYCGECTTNRSKGRSIKGKERPSSTKPFKECQVDGCGKTISNRKAMIQVFL